MKADKEKKKSMEVKIRGLIIKRLLLLHKWGAFMDSTEEEKQGIEIIKLLSYLL